MGGGGVLPEVALASARVYRTRTLWWLPLTVLSEILSISILTFLPLIFGATEHNVIYTPVNNSPTPFIANMCQ